MTLLGRAIGGWRKCADYKGPMPRPLKIGLWVLVGSFLVLYIASYFTWTRAYPANRHEEDGVVVYSFTSFTYEWEYTLYFLYFPLVWIDEQLLGYRHYFPLKLIREPSFRSLERSAGWHQEKGTGTFVALMFGAGGRAAAWASGDTVLISDAWARSPPSPRCEWTAVAHVASGLQTHTLTHSRTHPRTHSHTHAFPHPHTHTPTYPHTSLPLPTGRSGPCLNI